MWTNNMYREAQNKPEYGFAGQYVGVREVADEVCLVSFIEYDLGFFGGDVGRVEPATNAFVPEL